MKFVFKNVASSGFELHTWIHVCQNSATMVFLHSAGWYMKYFFYVKGLLRGESCQILRRRRVQLSVDVF